MYRIIVKGTVQGVGFRPFVYRNAVKKNVKGEVKNAGYGVEITADKKEPILNALKNPPPLSKIDSIDIESIESKPYDNFEIKKSEASKGETILPPDVFTCENCLRELRDKNNRRYGYFFITCTDCGPRFSMIENYPYDRPYTSMKDFDMCKSCEEEYKNPLDRRYHAQTIACHECGPELKLLDKNSKVLADSEEDSIKKAAQLIKDDGIIAIKGVGGFHIATNCNGRAVNQLRALLNRKHKPFAVMVRDEEMLKSFARVTKQELELLKSPQRPIVVCKKRNYGDFLEISELDSVGVMFPYTALHYLLFDHLDKPIVMTSANTPGEPVLLEEGIAPFFLTHNRRIVNRCDDSVIKIIAETPVFLRRSRGYVPSPIPLPFKCKDTVALGALSNNTITVTKGQQAFVSQHIGNCSKLKTYEFFKNTVEKFIGLTRCTPEIIAIDKHPEYDTRKYAQELSKKYNAKIIEVQHHKGHLASAAGEHGLPDYVGIATDGLGYGEDGELWGGEVFSVKNHSEFERVGRLEKQPMLGGDSAAKYPKKMLFGILSKLIDKKAISKLNLYTEKEIKVYSKMLEQSFNVIQTSSTGRILDSVSALLGICNESTYEGRAAMLLESTATKGEKLEPVIKTKKHKILMTSPLFEYLLRNLEKPKEELAWTAHYYIAQGLLRIAMDYFSNIIISGGVSYNSIIGNMVSKSGILQTKLPPGDGGVSYGQAIIANQYFK